MKTQKLIGEDAELMIMEGLNDLSTDQLAQILHIMLDKPVSYDSETDLITVEWGAA